MKKNNTAPNLLTFPQPERLGTEQQGGIDPLQAANIISFPARRIPPSTDTGDLDEIDVHAYMFERSGELTAFPDGENFQFRTPTGEIEWLLIRVHE